MNRFLWSLVTLLPLLFWQKLSPLLFGPADPSQAPASRSGMARGVAQFVGGSGLSEIAITIISLVAIASSVAFGLVTHLMLGDKGLGSKLNGLIGLVGGGAVVAAWFMFVPTTAFSYSAIFFTAVFGSTTLLAAACVLRALALSKVDDYMSGASAPARRPAAMRIAAVAGRRR